MMRKQLKVKEENSPKVAEKLILSISCSTPKEATKQQSFVPNLNANATPPGRKLLGFGFTTLRVPSFLIEDSRPSSVQ